MRAVLMTTPRPTGTSADPPSGCGPAWERPGARPAKYRLTPGVSCLDPRGPVGRVFQLDALPEQFLADLIGTSKVTRVLCCGAFGNELLDARLVDVAAALHVG